MSDSNIDLARLLRAYTGSGGPMGYARDEGPPAHRPGPMRPPPRSDEAILPPGAFMPFVDAYAPPPDGQPVAEPPSDHLLGSSPGPRVPLGPGAPPPQWAQHNLLHRVLSLPGSASADVIQRGLNREISPQETATEFLATGPFMPPVARAVPGAMRSVGDTLSRLLRSGAGRATAGTGALTLAASDAAPQQGRAQPSEEVRLLQTRLKNAGHYRGPIDGIMGEATQQANRAFIEAESSRAAADLASRQAQTEAERLALEKQNAENAQANRTEGNRRMQDAENNVGVGRHGKLPPQRHEELPPPLS